MAGFFGFAAAAAGLPPSPSCFSSRLTRRKRSTIGIVAALLASAAFAILTRFGIGFRDHLRALARR